MYVDNYICIIKSDFLIKINKNVGIIIIKKCIQFNDIVISSN